MYLQWKTIHFATCCCAFQASQDVILNRSADLAEERTKTVNETVAVYDLLAIALVRKGCFSFLSKVGYFFKGRLHNLLDFTWQFTLSLSMQTLERALKFSYQEFQIWYQFALSLIASQKVSLTIHLLVLIPAWHRSAHFQFFVDFLLYCYAKVQRLEVNNQQISWAQYLLCYWPYTR